MDTFKRIGSAVLAIVLLMTIVNPLFVRAEETSSPAMQYRYREKEYTTSIGTELCEPWVLSHTTTDYTHSNYDYVYLEAQVVSVQPKRIIGKLKTARIIASMEAR